MAATIEPDVFAAGDVEAGMGCMAALEAERYLAKHDNHAIATDGANRPAGLKGTR